MTLGSFGDLGRRALGDLLPVVEDDDLPDTFMTACIRCSIMITVTPSLADLPDHVEHLGDLLRIQSGEHFVGRTSLEDGAARARASSSRFFWATFSLPASISPTCREAEVREHLVSDLGGRREREVLPAEACPDRHVSRAPKDR